MQIMNVAFCIADGVLSDFGHDVVKYQVIVNTAMFCFCSVASPNVIFLVCQIRIVVGFYRKKIDDGVGCTGICFTMSGLALSIAV